MHTAIINHVREIYGTGFVPLHRPTFNGNEKKYLVDCIDSNFVSSVGPEVTLFEKTVANFVGTKYGIATVNGTSALHVALLVAGVGPNTEVITQALTFVATANAIKYCGASPVFVDVDNDTLGMSPNALEEWLSENTKFQDGATINLKTGKRVWACVPMHTFGFPCRIKEINNICIKYNITLIEDAAESLGSYINQRHTGTVGKLSTVSFNGNKIITTGGGGMVLTNDELYANKIKHLTTTAKLPHSYEYFHDQVGFNYRLPNLNAAMGLAQMEVLPRILQIKHDVANSYRDFCKNNNFVYIDALSGNTANNWLNTILVENETQRNNILEKTNAAGVMTRPIWTLLSKLPAFSACQKDHLKNSIFLSKRIINLPSSVPDSRILDL